MIDRFMINYSPCTLEVDLSKIRNNYKILDEICKTATVSAVVKANSYGLGADKIAPALSLEGCKDFFVTTINEAISLREVVKDGNIFVLNGLFDNDVEQFQEYNLIPVINHLEQLSILKQLALKSQKKQPCILHINTGMNRLAMPMREADHLIDNLSLLEGIDIKYVMSHLASSEEKENPYNKEQLDKFKGYLQYFPKTKASLANSSGVFLGNEYHFDLVRPGFALYGGNPTPNKPNPMKNPVKLTAQIIQLQNLSHNNYIGYNSTFLSNRNSVIATLPFGYADGYSRNLSNKGEVFIDGHSAPVVGRVSMDLVTIDVTDIPANKIFLGAEVEIIGDNCTADKIASMSGTIGYEILTRLGNRYKRVYTE